MLTPQPPRCQTVIFVLIFLCHPRARKLSKFTYKQLQSISLMHSFQCCFFPRNASQHVCFTHAANWAAERRIICDQMQRRALMDLRDCSIHTCNAVLHRGEVWECWSNCNKTHSHAFFTYCIGHPPPMSSSRDEIQTVAFLPHW